MNMTEPLTTAGGAAAGYKLALLGIPIIGTLFGFWLGLRFIPLQKDKEVADLTNRVMACVACGLIIGPLLLAALFNHFPGLMERFVYAASMLGIDSFVATLYIMGCCFVVASMPGPWIISAIFLFIRRNKNKDIGQLVTQVKGKKQEIE